MKKTVLTFGLISGAMISLMMLATLPFLDKIGFEKGEIIGYTSMVLSFLMVFFGIRSYRENVGQGKVTFGRAFAIGILIQSSLASAMSLPGRSSTSNSLRILWTSMRVT